VPSRNGWVSDTPPGRHSTDCRPMPGLAALVTLLPPVVPTPEDVAEPVAVPASPPALEPEAERVPLAPAPRASVADVPELAAPVAAPPALTPPVVVALVALVVIPSIVAPRPGPPAEADPVDDPPPVVPGADRTPTVGVLVSVAPEVTLAEGFDGVPVVAVDGLIVGNVTLPVPTCPPPSVPGVGPPDAGSPELCAAAGSATSDSIATSARIAFMPFLFVPWATRRLAGRFR